MKLYQFLQKYKITQQQLANKINLNQVTISKYIRELRTPRPEIMQKIHEVTGGLVSYSDWYINEVDSNNNVNRGINGAINSVNESINNNVNGVNSGVNGSVNTKKVLNRIKPKVDNSVILELKHARGLRWAHIARALNTKLSDEALAWRVKNNKLTKHEVNTIVNKLGN